MLYDKQIISSKLKKVDVDAGIRRMNDEVQSLIEHSIGIGHWEFAPSRRVFSISQRAATIFGLPTSHDVAEFAEIFSCFMPIDSEKFEKLVDSAINDRVGFEAILRLYHRGEAQVVEIFCKPVTGPNDVLLSLVGTVRDITDRAKKLAISNGRAAIMRVLMRNIPSAVAVLDTQMVYLSASDHWAAGHGFESVDDLLGKCHYDLLDHAKQFSGDHKKVIGGETLKSKRAFLRDSDGVPIEQTCVMCPWRTGEGKIGGMIIMLGTVDITKTYKFAKKDEAVDKALPEHASGLLELLESVT